MRLYSQRLKWFIKSLCLCMYIRIKAFSADVSKMCTVLIAKFLKPQDELLLCCYSHYVSKSFKKKGETGIFKPLYSKGPHSLVHYLWFLLYKLNAFSSQGETVTKKSYAELWLVFRNMWSNIICNDLQMLTLLSMLRDA